MSSNLILCILFTLFGSFGGYFFKKAASGSSSILKILFNVNLYIGGFFYVLGAFLNILVLRTLPYTVVMPITSVTYVWTIIISYFILKEKITIKKVIGLTLIIIGAIILGSLR